MKHWIKLAPQPLFVLAILPASPSPRCHCATTGVPFHARRALNFYCLSITFLHVCESPLSPLANTGPPAGQSTAQQGAFTPICYRLSPFVLTDNRMSPSPTTAATESHLVRVTRGTSLCFSWLLFKYCIMHLCSAARLK